MENENDDIGPKLKAKKAEKEKLQSDIDDYNEKIAACNEKRRMIKEQLDIAIAQHKKQDIDQFDTEQTSEPKIVAAALSKINKGNLKDYQMAIENRLKEKLSVALKEFEDKIKNNEASQLIKIVKIELELSADEIKFYNLSSMQPDHYKQAFKIDSKTSFGQLIEYACKFWGLKCQDFTMQDQIGGDIGTELKSNIEDFFKRTLSNQHDEPSFKLKKKQRDFSLLEMFSDKNTRNTAKIKMNENWDKNITELYPGLLFYESEEATTTISAHAKSDDETQKHFIEQETKKLGPIIEKLDASFCGVLLVILLIIFTIIGISGMYSIESQRWMIHSLNQSFSIAYDHHGDYDFFSSYSEDITRYENVSKYYDKLTNTIFTNNTNSVKIHNIFISSISFRVLMSKEKSCAVSTIAKGFVCYQENVNVNTVMSEMPSFLTSINDSITFVDDLPYTIKGKFGSYYGGGFNLEFDPKNKDDEESFRSYTSKLFEYVTHNEVNSIRAFITSFTIFNPKSLLACNINIVIEKSTSGRIKFFPLYFKPYKLSVFEKNSTTFSIEVAKLMMSAYFIICITNLISALKPFKKQMFNPYRTIAFIFHIFLDAVNLLLIVINFIIECTLSRYTFEQLFNGNMVQMNLYAHQSQTTASLCLSCINLVILVYRLIKCLKISTKLAFIVSYIENAFMYLVLYFACLLPLLLSLSFMLMAVWGPFMPEYTSFSYALISQMLMMVGKIDTYILMAYNPRFGLIYIILIFLVSYYFLYITLFSIHVSEYQKNVRERGYPDDKEEEFSFSSSVHWMLQWLPAKILYRTNLKEIENDIKE